MGMGRAHPLSSGGLAPSAMSGYEAARPPGVGSAGERDVGGVDRAADRDRHPLPPLESKLGQVPHRPEEGAQPAVTRRQRVSKELQGIALLIDHTDMGDPAATPDAAAGDTQKGAVACRATTGHEI